MVYLKNVKKKIMDNKDAILKLLKKTYKKLDHNHFSYCSFPSEDCSCRDIKDINEHTSILNEGYIDSMTLVSFISRIESEFNIKISDKDVIPVNFDSVEKIDKLLKKYQKL